MKVYKIIEDVNNYQWVMPVKGSDLIEHLSFECKPKKKDWTSLDMYVFNPRKEVGNFYSLGGVGSFAFDEKVLDVMQTVFEISGEILPLNLGKTKLYTLNILECINSLDETKSTWDYYDDGSRGRILNYAFHEQRTSESSIFKIPETYKSEVLTHSGIKDTEDDFFQLYNRSGFKGLTFELLYSSP